MAMKRLLSYFIFTLTIISCSSEMHDPECVSGKIPLFTLSPSFSVYISSGQIDRIWMKNGSECGFSVDLSLGDTTFRMLGNNRKNTSIVLEGGAVSETWECRYSFLGQSGTWFEYDYDDSAWETGEGPFGTDGTVQEPWSSPKLYIRRYFDNCADYMDAALYMDYCLNGTADIYINGRFVKVISGNGKLQRAELARNASDFIRSGRNIIAAEVSHESGQSAPVFDFGLEINRSDNYGKAELKGISANAGMSEFHFDCGSAEAVLSFIAPGSNFGCHPVNYFHIQVSDIEGCRNDMNLEICFDLHYVTDSICLGNIGNVGKTYICSNSGAELFSPPSHKDIWGKLYIGIASDNCDLSAGNGIIRLGISEPNTENLDVIGYVGYDEEYIMQLFGNNIRPAWNHDGKTYIGDIIRQDIGRFDSIVENCDKENDASLRLLKSGLRLGMDADRNLLYVTDKFLNRMTEISGIADTLAANGETELLEGLMNPIFMYAESELWDARFCPPDIGYYPFAMHRITDDSDYIGITSKALGIIADIDSLAGNGNYSKRHKDIIKEWEDFIKRLNGSAWHCPHSL